MKFHRRNFFRLLTAILSPTVAGPLVESMQCSKLRITFKNGIAVDICEL